MTLATHILTIALSFCVVLLVIVLLRRNMLREKYVVIWLVTGLSAVIASIWPSLVSSLSRFLGFGVPSNFLFLINGVLLLLISIQLSAEISILEHQTELLAEEVALIKLRIQVVEDHCGEAE